MWSQWCIHTCEKTITVAGWGADAAEIAANSSNINIQKLCSVYWPCEWNK